MHMYDHLNKQVVKYLYGFVKSIQLVHIDHTHYPGTRYTLSIHVVIDYCPVRVSCSRDYSTDNNHEDTNIMQSVVICYQSVTWIRAN